jgi:hypothetical protein
MTTPGSYCRKKGLWIFPPVVAVSTMLSALLAAGALGVAAVGVAAPASAYSGGVLRNCPQLFYNTEYPYSALPAACPPHWPGVPHGMHPGHGPG